MLVKYLLEVYILFLLYQQKHPISRIANIQMIPLLKVSDYIS